MCNCVYISRYEEFCKQETCRYFSTFLNRYRYCKFLRHHKDPSQVSIAHTHTHTFGNDGNGEEKDRWEWTTPPLCNNDTYTANTTHGNHNIVRVIQFLRTVRCVIFGSTKAVKILCCFRVHHFFHRIPFPLVFANWSVTR